MAELKEKLGVLISKDNFTLIKKEGLVDEDLAKHNHSGKNVLFTVVKGKVKIWINEEEEFIVEPGKVVSFDGENYINGKMLEDSEFFITLIDKPV